VCKPEKHIRRPAHARVAVHWKSIASARHLSSAEFELGEQWAANISFTACEKDIRLRDTAVVEHARRVDGSCAAHDACKVRRLGLDIFPRLFLLRRWSHDGCLDRVGRDDGVSTARPRSHDVLPRTGGSASGPDPTLRAVGALSAQGVAAAPSAARVVEADAREQVVRGHLVIYFPRR